MIFVASSMWQLKIIYKQMKTVVAIHTAMTMVEPTKALFAEHVPEVRLINIADESLIQDVIRDGKVSPAVGKRLLNYYFSAVDAGADVIFNTCSSIGEVAIMARNFLPVPLVKIDDAMAREAVTSYKRIGVLSTLPTTLGPTMNLVRRFSELLSKPVEVQSGLAEGAFQALMDGNTGQHDHLILETAEKIASKVDVFVLAQGSMAKMKDAIVRSTGKPVLSSPLSGVLNVKSVVENLGNQ